MIFQALIAMCVFAAISYINFFVLTPSFFTVLTGIATAIIALFSLIAAIMMLFSEKDKTTKDNSVNNE